MASTLKWWFGFIFCLLSGLAAAQPIEAAVDLARQGRQVTQEQQIFLLYVSRPDCPYCAQLEKAVLLPMLKDPLLTEKIYLAELSWTSALITDYNGQQRSGTDIVNEYGIFGTPTLLFLDGAGHEIAERLVGYQSVDFYWSYFERTIASAWATLSNPVH